MNLAGYAAGDYFVVCRACGARFTGDKRAVRCEPCASKILPVMVELDGIAGMAELASNPRTSHLYDKYEVLVRIGVQSRELLRELQQLPAPS